MLALATPRTDADGPTTISAAPGTSAAAAPPAPPNPQAIDAVKRGDAAFAKHDLTTAISEYTNAANADPHFEAAYMHCGDAQTAGHHLKEALEQYQKAINLGTGDTQAFMRHARCAYQLNDVDTAMKDCDQAIAD